MSDLGFGFSGSRLLLGGLEIDLTLWFRVWGGLGFRVP